MENVQTTVHQPTLFLDNLIPDCLFEIYEYLEPLDIAILSESSVHLSNFAEEHIYKKYSNLDLLEDEEYRDEHGEYTWQEMELLLRHFGKHLKLLSIQSFHFETREKIEFAVKSCPHLDELRILNFEFEDDPSSILKTLQCSAKHLTLKGGLVAYSRWADVLKMWPSVTDLTVFGAETDEEPGIVGNMLMGVDQIEWLTLIKTYIKQDFFIKLQKYQEARLRKLSLIDMFNSSDCYADDMKMKSNYNNLPPNVEQLQISVANSSCLKGLAKTNLKYLQILYRRQKTSNATNLKWSLSGLPLLEVLDLYGIDGYVCRVAGKVPSLRYLSIQNANISKSDGLADIIAKLPNLQRLRLRNCEFSPDELMTGIETNRNLTQIDLEEPKKDSLIKLMESLSLGLNNSNQLYSVPCSAFELQIIVATIDVSIYKR